MTERTTEAVGRAEGTPAPADGMDDARWEPGMPVLDRQAARTPADVRPPVLPPSLAALPPRSVPETRPTPLQRHYVNLSAIVLVAGAIAITALEAGLPLGSPLVRLCVVVGAPILVVTTADATLRIWRSAWAWMPVDRSKALFRFAWLIVAVVGLAALVAGSIVVVLA